MPVKIYHAACNGTFSIYYMKFLADPRCRICQRQGHLKTRNTDDFKKDILDLEGDNYTLLDEYVGPRSPVRILHNTCGEIQTYLPHRFLDGQRCRKCHVELTDEEFKDYVEQYTLGRYIITGKATKNLYTIFDTENVTENHLLKSKILQELRRPTLSPILPLKQKDSATKRPLRKREALLSYITNKFGNGIFFTEDVIYENMTKEEIHSALGNLTKSGKIQHIASGIYGAVGHQYTVNEIIYEKYLVRYGKRIGFLRGKSYAYKIGIEEKPDEWHIATNKESAKTLARKIKFMGTGIHIKGCPSVIDDNNYLVLEAIDFLLQFSQCTNKSLKEVTTAMRSYISNANSGKMPDRQSFDAIINDYKTANIRTLMLNRVNMLFSGD